MNARVFLLLTVSTAACSTRLEVLEGDPPVTAPASSPPPTSVGPRVVSPVVTTGTTACNPYASVGLGVGSQQTSLTPYGLHALRPGVAPRSLTGMAPYTNLRVIGSTATEAVVEARVPGGGGTCAGDECIALLAVREDGSGKQAYPLAGGRLGEALSEPDAVTFARTRYVAAKGSGPYAFTLERYRAGLGVSPVLTPDALAGVSFTDARSALVRSGSDLVVLLPPVVGSSDGPTLRRVTAGVLTTLTTLPKLDIATAMPRIAASATDVYFAYPDGPSVNASELALFRVPTTGGAPQKIASLHSFGAFSLPAVAWDSARGRVVAVTGREVVEVAPDATNEVRYALGASLAQQPGTLSRAFVAAADGKIFVSEACNDDADAPQYAPRVFDLATSTKSWRDQEPGYPLVAHVRHPVDPAMETVGLMTRVGDSLIVVR